MKPSTPKTGLPTGNYAWGDTNGIYFVEISGTGYVPVLPKEHGCELWEPHRAMQIYLGKIAEGELRKEEKNEISRIQS